MLVAAPLFFAVGLMIQLMFLGAWQRIEPRIRFDRRPHLVALAIMSITILLAFVGIQDKNVPDDVSARGVDGVTEWIAAAVMLGGSSYLSLLMLTTRVWLAMSPRGAFTWSFVVPLTLFVLPALMAAFGSGLSSFFVVVWVYPGYMGIVTAVLALVLVIELVSRLRKKAKQMGMRPPPPPDPPAANAGKLLLIVVVTITAAAIASAILASF